MSWEPACERMASWRAICDDRGGAAHSSHRRRDAERSASHGARIAAVVRRLDRGWSGNPAGRSTVGPTYGPRPIVQRVSFRCGADGRHASRAQRHRLWRLYREEPRRAGIHRHMRPHRFIYGYGARDPDCPPGRSPRPPSARLVCRARAASDRTRRRTEHHRRLRSPSCARRTRRHGAVDGSRAEPDDRPSSGRAGVGAAAFRPLDPREAGPSEDGRDRLMLRRVSPARALSTSVCVDRHCGPIPVDCLPR